MRGIVIRPKCRVYDLGWAWSTCTNKPSLWSNAAYKLKGFVLGKGIQKSERLEWQLKQECSGMENDNKLLKLNDVDIYMACRIVCQCFCVISFNYYNYYFCSFYTATIIIIISFLFCFYCCDTWSRFVVLHTLKRQRQWGNVTVMKLIFSHEHKIKYDNNDNNHT